MTAMTKRLAVRGKAAAALPAPLPEETNRWHKLAARFSIRLRVRAQLRPDTFCNPETQRTYLSFNQTRW